VRKPKTKFSRNKKVYVGVDSFIWVGGPYYEDFAQLHIDSVKDAKFLHLALGKAIAYLEAKESK
jgi:hypothetical protein